MNLTMAKMILRFVRQSNLANIKAMSNSLKTPPLKLIKDASKTVGRYVDEMNRMLGKATKGIQRKGGKLSSQDAPPGWNNRDIWRGKDSLRATDVKEGYSRNIGGVQPNRDIFPSFGRGATTRTKQVSLETESWIPLEESLPTQMQQKFLVDVMKLPKRTAWNIIKPSYAKGRLTKMKDEIPKMKKWPKRKGIKRYEA